LNRAFPTPARSLLELGPLTIHYYALCIITGIAIAIWLGGKRFQYKTAQGQSVVSEVAIVAVPSGIIGGRIYHVISSPNAYFGKGGEPIDAFKIWEGGLGIWETLVDSAPDLMDAHNYVMQKFGYNQKPLTNIRHLAGRGAANMILRSLKEDGKKFDQNIHEKMTEEFINYYRENISKKSQIIKGVNEFLAWGKSQKINFAICTNKMESLAKKLLKEINLIEFFDYIAGADTFEYRKPDPRHLTNILEILDVKKEDSIMVGDSETDAETARIAKVNFILVKGGYTEKDQNSIYHNHFINDFTEMNGILSKMKFLN